MEAVWQPWSTVFVEIPTDGICTVLAEGIHRIYGVALGLAHLLAVLVLNMAQNDNVLVGGIVKEQGGDSQQGVEPATGLIHSLGDKVCRIALIEDFLVLKRIMPLGKRHGTGVKPAVNNLWHTLHLAAALWALDGNSVDIWTMKLDFLWAVVGHGLQLCNGTDGVLMAAGAFPYVQRSTPITVAADAPILYVLQPLPKATLADGVRNPVDGVVVGNELFLYGGHLDEPGLPSIVNQRSIATPAVWIAMLELWCLKELAALLQVVQNQWICILDEGAGPVGFCGHIALGINKLYKRHIVVTANPSIVLTESRSGMYDTGTVAGSNIAIAHYVEGLLVNLALCIRIERLILTAFQILALETLNNRVLPFLVGKYGLNQSLSHDQILSLIGYLYIVYLWVYYQTQVGRQGPWSGGPCQEVGVFLILGLELYHGRAFLYILVALSYLMGGQRGATARAVRYYLVALVQEALLPDFVQCPPYGLDVVVFVGDIWVLHVSPEANYIGEFLPHALVLPYGLTALLDKWLNAVFLDLLFAVQTKELLYLQLYWQAVGIPASLAENLLALHGLIAWQHILDNAGQHVADMWLAVGCWWAIIECEGVTAFAAADAFVGDVVFFPEFQNFGFSVYEV